MRHERNYVYKRGKKRKPILHITVTPNTLSFLLLQSSFFLQRTWRLEVPSKVVRARSTKAERGEGRKLGLKSQPGAIHEAVDVVSDWHVVRNCRERGY
jgi:hypothetical protein